MEVQDDTAVVEFMGITGVATPDEAQNFLEMAGGDLAQAVALYMDLQTGGRTPNDQAAATEDVRAPMESFEDQIVDIEQDQRNIERLVEQDANAMQNRMQFDNDSGDTSHPSALNSLFAAPSFSDKRQWYECLQTGKDSQRWVFVNIQHKEVFECHRLNRDLWSDETVIEIMTANFVFWQRDTDSTEGSVFCQRYKVDVNDKTNLPFLCVVDPRTGQLIKSWTSGAWTRGGPHVAADFLYSFLDRNSLQNTPTGHDLSRGESSKRPVPDHSATSSDAEPMGVKQQRVRENSPVRAEEAIIAQKEKQAELPMVDEAKPTTQVQIRFIDGSKRAFQFNEDHCVNDLYSVVASVLGNREFQICGGFPPKPIDQDLTLREAGLCQSSVTVRKK